MAILAIYNFLAEVVFKDLGHSLRTAKRCLPKGVLKTRNLKILGEIPGKHPR